MLKTFGLSSPLFQKAVRIGFATALAASFVATATVSIASTLDNGTDVGDDCYKSYPKDPNGLDHCMKEECKTGGRDAQQQADCYDKAKDEASKNLDKRHLVEVTDDLSTDTL